MAIPARQLKVRNRQAADSESLKKFREEVTKFCTANTVDEFTKFQADLALRATTRIVTRTPFRSGLTKGNWQVTISLPPSQAVPFKDPSGVETIERAKEALKKIPPFDIVYISNLLPQSVVLEYGLFEPADPGPSKKPKTKGKVLVKGGYSTQAPAGMLAITIAELNEGFKNELPSNQ